MSSSEERSNPLAAPGDHFTSTLHSDTYPAIDSTKANLRDKAVFIVGGTKNIGRTIALSFAKAGVSAIGIGGRSNNDKLSIDIHSAAQKAGKDPPDVLISQLDVRDAESINAPARNFRDRFTKLDILICCAGVLSKAEIKDSNQKTWWNDFKTNLRGPYIASRAFLPLLEKQGGQIVILSTVGAFLTIPSLSSYQISKLAVLRLAEFLNAEFADRGIIAWCLHPGLVPGTNLFPGEVPEYAKPFYNHSSELCGDTIVYLSQEKREWLGGRYISATWDMPELVAKREEICKGDKLKVALKL